MPARNEGTGPYRIPERPATTSAWMDVPAPADHPPLQEDARADVAIVGGGIAGILAAYHLAKAGREVMLLERYRLASGESALTTAHLTYVVDSRLRDLARIHGEDGARRSWQASVFAIDQVERIAREEGIACDLERLDGILYGDFERDTEVLREEAELARRIGYSSEPVDPGTVPFPSRAALRFPRQAKFHPRKFLLGLAARLDAMGVRIHEGTEVKELHYRAGKDERGRITTREDHSVEAEVVLSTSNVPLFEESRMYMKYFPYRSYVIAARTRTDAIPEALWWSTFEPGKLYAPYYYTRVEPGPDSDLVILGGEDHKAGHSGDPAGAWRRLEDYLREAVRGPVEVEHRWSGHIIETADGLPYIGVHPGSPPQGLVATGFSGNGMTFGALAGWMLAERAQGRATAYDEVFDPGRLKASIPELLSESKDYPAAMVAKPFKGSEVASPAALAPGQAAVLVHGGQKLAVYRDEGGDLHALKADCSHLGCLVRWNGAETSWDCPCHGSRFAVDGRVVNGPASVPLERVELPEQAKVEAPPRRGE